MLLIRPDSYFFIVDSIILVLRVITVNNGSITGITGGFSARDVVQPI